LAIKLQNRVFLTIELSKPFIFDHLAVLKGGFADVDDTWQWGPHVSLSPPAEEELSAAESAGVEKERERGKRREEKKLTCEPHCHVSSTSAKPPFKTAR